MAKQCSSLAQLPDVDGLDHSGLLSDSGPVDESHAYLQPSPVRPLSPHLSTELDSIFGAYTAGFPEPQAATSANGMGTTMDENGMESSCLVPCRFCGRRKASKQHESPNGKRAVDDQEFGLTPAAFVSIFNTTPTYTLCHWKCHRPQCQRSWFTYTFHLFNFDGQAFQDDFAVLDTYTANIRRVLSLERPPPFNSGNPSPPSPIFSGYSSSYVLSPEFPAQPMRSESISPLNIPLSSTPVPDLVANDSRQWGLASHSAAPSLPSHEEIHGTGIVNGHGSVASSMGTTADRERMRNNKISGFGSDSFIDISSSDVDPCHSRGSTPYTSPHTSPQSNKGDPAPTANAMRNMDHVNYRRMRNIGVCQACRKSKTKCDVSHPRP